MKKTLITLLIALSTLVTNAQETTFGAKLGANFTNYYGDDVDNSKTGFVGGFTAEISLNDNISIQPELLFSFEGSKDSDLNYLRIPMIAKYYPTEGLSLNFGPQLGILMLAEDSDGEDLKDATNTIDVDLQFGSTYTFEGGLSITAAYNYGLTEIFKESDAKLSAFQISLGYSFL